MKKFVCLVMMLCALTFTSTALLPGVTVVSAQAPKSIPCTLPKTTFFGLPTWYEYLDGEQDPLFPTKCIAKIDFENTGFRGLLPIGLAVIDNLLRVAGMVAVGFLIYSGFLYITSQGEPDKTTQAKDGIINALVGLGIALIASIVVAYIGFRLTR